MEMLESERRLAEFFVQREGEGVLDILKTENLVEAGLLDSLDMVSLATYIEREFSRRLDLTKAEVVEAMATFDSLHKLACE